MAKLCSSVKKKGYLKKIAFSRVSTHLRWTNRRADGRTDGRTGTPRTRLKRTGWPRGNRSDSPQRTLQGRQHRARFGIQHSRGNIQAQCPSNRGEHDELNRLPFHCGPDQPKTQTEVLGHLLVRLLIRSYHSLILLLRTACSARVLCYALFLTPSLLGQ